MDEEANVIQISIPKFIEYIRIAEARRPKPILKNGKKKLPKKYQNDDYIWNKKGYLINAHTGSVVASNSVTVDQPRDWRINGQDIYNQKIKHSTRGGIMQKLHDKFNPYLRNLDPIDRSLFPFCLDIKFYVLDYDKVKTRVKNLDNDNRWIYEKVIQDTLRDLGKIPDDCLKYINENRKKTIFVEDPEDVRLEISIYKSE